MLYQKLEGNRVALWMDGQVQVDWSMYAGIELCFEPWLWIERSIEVQASSAKAIRRDTKGAYSQPRGNSSYRPNQACPSSLGMGKTVQLSLN